MTAPVSNLFGVFNLQTLHKRTGPPESPSPFSSNCTMLARCSNMRAANSGWRNDIFSVVHAYIQSIAGQVVTSLDTAIAVDAVLNTRFERSL